MPRQEGWWVQKNLEEEEQPLGEEVPTDAWRVLQKVTRHSFSLVLTLKHSWHSICHPWQPGCWNPFAFTVVQISFAITQDVGSARGVFVLLASTGSASQPCSARWRGAAPQQPLLGAPWTCGVHAEIQIHDLQKAFNSVPQTPQNLRTILFWTTVLPCCVRQKCFLSLLSCWSNISLVSAQGVSQDSPQARHCSDRIS